MVVLCAGKVDSAFLFRIDSGLFEEITNIKICIFAKKNCHDD